MRMRKLWLIICLLLLTTAPALAKPDNLNSLRTITVQGSSQIEVIPDQAEISIGVVTNGSTAEGAQQSNTRLSAAVQQKLIATGIARDKILTTQYAVYPVHESKNGKSDETPAIVGYRVSHTVVVTIDDVDKLGSIIDAALAAGANQILGIHFKKQNDLQLKNLVLQNAVKEATSKAESLAGAFGKKLTNVLTIQESGLSVTSPEYQQRYLLKAQGSPVTPIMAGSIQVSGSVTITFEIE